jgi:hypothetical protein
MLDGYKGKIGGFGMILTGLGMIALGFKNGNVFDVLPEAFATIMAGLGIFGIRVAMDKDTTTDPQ